MSGLLHLQRVIDTRNVDSQAAAWIVDALVRWDRSGGDGAMLLRMMDCPTTAAKRRLAVRDRWLCAASDHLGGLNPSDRGRRLYDAARLFESRKWPLWKIHSTAPAHASIVEGVLFMARRASPFPNSAKRFSNILADAFS